MTMIFDFLKKIFGWLDEGSKKRKASEEFDKDYRTPKRFKNTCNTEHLMEDYYDVDESDEDDIVFLSENQYLPMRPCAKLNGSCSKQPQSCKSHMIIPSSSCKSTCSPHINKSTMEHFNHRHKIQDANRKCPTLCKTNQLRERYQYEELLHNFIPDRIHILKDKHVEHGKHIEVVDLEKYSEVVSSNNKSRPVANTSAMMSSCCRRDSLSNTRIDKGKVSSLDRSKKNTMTCWPPSKVITIDKSDVSNVMKPAPKSPVKAVATNSLRDELAAKAVMRQDFIPQVAKRYNERIEQRHKEAEELKKMTCVLSKHNRYAREAALEEQLARSMRHCLAILDDRDELEEPALPKLTDQMLREVKSALTSCPPDEVLAEGFGLRITRKDLHTLAGLNWLNDEVINFYMNLLIARGTSSSKFPKIHAMNTFFYPKLLSGGHSSLRRWTRKVDIFAQDLVVVPVHLDIHWCMSIIDFRDKSIVYYDSMGGSNSKCLAALKQYLQDESLDKKKQTYEMNSWTLRSAKNIPQQMNGSDCGVFSCMFAEYACANRKITFTQEDMPYFRNKMVYEILKGKLL